MEEWVLIVERETLADISDVLDSHNLSNNVDDFWKDLHLIFFYIYYSSNIVGITSIKFQSLVCGFVSSD